MLVLGLVSRSAAIVAMAATTGLLYEMYRPVVAAAIADVVPSDDRPRAYGLIYWAVNLGASVAPLLGASVATRSVCRAVFMFPHCTISSAMSVATRRSISAGVIDVVPPLM